MCLIYTLRPFLRKIIINFVCFFVHCHFQYPLFRRSCVDLVRLCCKISIFFTYIGLWSVTENNRPMCFLVLIPRLLILNFYLQASHSVFSFSGVKIPRDRRADSGRIRSGRRSSRSSLSHLAMGLRRRVQSQVLPSQEQAVSHHQKCTLHPTVRTDGIFRGIGEDHRIRRCR